MKKINEMSGRFFFKEGKMYPVEQFDDRFLIEGKNIYEVIRVTEGIPVFFEDHLQRFRRSLQLYYMEDFIRIDIFYDTCLEVIRRNSLSNGNIKIVAHQDSLNRELIIYPVPHHYPEKDKYTSGVITEMINLERKDPEIKNWYPLYKKRILEIKKEKDIYEAILINNEGIITEGSQSNIFFIKGKQVYTSPESIVLSGITRKFVFKICKDLGISIVEREIPAESIKDFDSAFLSGTSPKILPIYSVRPYTFEVNNSILRKIQSAYEQIIVDYLNKHNK